MVYRSRRRDRQRQEQAAAVAAKRNGSAPGVYVGMYGSSAGAARGGDLESGSVAMMVGDDGSSLQSGGQRYVSMEQQRMAAGKPLPSGSLSASGGGTSHDSSSKNNKVRY